MCDIAPKTLIIGGGPDKPQLSLKGLFLFFQKIEVC